MSFADQCYNLIKRIPKGKVTTYKEIADALGSKAYRAVGTAMRNNPRAPEVPCHRVVRNDGGISGYRLGVDKKIALLKSEGIKIEGGKVKDFEKVKFKF